MNLDMADADYMTGSMNIASAFVSAKNIVDRQVHRSVQPGINNYQIAFTIVLYWIKERLTLFN